MELHSCFEQFTFWSIPTQMANEETKKSVHIVLEGHPGKPGVPGKKGKNGGKGERGPSQDDEARGLPNKWKKIQKALSKSAKSTFERIRAFNKGKEPHHLASAKKVPIKEKIHPRYLELEPLCCLSSCLVRTGCYTVVVFECVCTLIIAFIIALKIYDGGRIDIWDELDVNFNAIVTHQTALYLLGLFSLLMLITALCLVYGLLSFERSLVKLHWHFDFFALGFNVLVFVLYVFALNSEGPETWTWKNVILVITFAAQIPLQLWAISVVKSCYDFYVLLYVFVTLAEK